MCAFATRALLHPRLFLTAKGASSQISLCYTSVFYILFIVASAGKFVYWPIFWLAKPTAIMCVSATRALLHPRLFLTAKRASSQAGLYIRSVFFILTLARSGNISANPLDLSAPFELKCSEASGLTVYPIWPMLISCWWCTAFNSTTESTDLETCLTKWTQRCAKARIASTNRVVLGHSIGCEAFIIPNWRATITEVPSDQPTFNARKTVRCARRCCPKYLQIACHWDALERTVAKLGPSGSISCGKVTSSKQTIKPSE